MEVLVSFRFFFGSLSTIQFGPGISFGWACLRKGELGEARETSQKSPKTSGWTKTTMHIEIPLRNSQGFQSPLEKMGGLQSTVDFLTAIIFWGTFFFFETQRIIRPSVIHGFLRVWALEGQGRHFRKVDVSIVNQRRCDIFMCTSKSNAYLYIYTIYL